MNDKVEWVWQFDPLNPSSQVEVTQGGEVIFLTSTLGNAQRLCQMLNSYSDMYEACKWALEDILSEHRQIKVSTKTALMKALAKAGGKC